MRTFDIDSLTLQFVRDIETLSWVKDEISKRLGKQVYKQVTILDMKGFGSKHMAGKFRTPVQELVQVLQYYYPETAHKMYIVNTPFVFRAAWAMVRSRERSTS